MNPFDYEALFNLAPDLWTKFIGKSLFISQSHSPLDELIVGFYLYLLDKKQIKVGGLLIGRSSMGWNLLDGNTFTPDQWNADYQISLSALIPGHRDEELINTCVVGPTNLINFKQATSTMVHVLPEEDPDDKTLLSRYAAVVERHLRIAAQNLRFVRAKVPLKEVDLPGLVVEVFQELTKGPREEE